MPVGEEELPCLRQGRNRRVDVATMNW